MATSGSDDKHRASVAAVEWLIKHHRQSVHDALQADYFGLLDDDDRANIVGISDNAREAIHSNAQEWLLAQAQLTLRNGRRVRACELVLGRGGPSLTRSQRAYLKCLAVRPLALYEVRDSSANDGIVLKNVFAEWERPWMAKRECPPDLCPTGFIGTRTIFMDGWQLAGIYPFSRDSGTRVREGILKLLSDPMLADEKWYSPRANDLLARIVVGCWLSVMATPRDMNLGGKIVNQT